MICPQPGILLDFCLPSSVDPPPSPSSQPSQFSWPTTLTSLTASLNLHKYWSVLLSWIIVYLKEACDVNSESDGCWWFGELCCNLIYITFIHNLLDIENPVDSGVRVINKYICTCRLFQCGSCWIWHEGNKYVCMCWLFQCGGQPDVLVCHLQGKANPLTFWQRHYEQQTVACKLLETGLISMVLIHWRCCCSAKF